MKTNRTTKIFVMALSALLLVACLFGISAVADETTPSVEISYNNIEYNDNNALCYAVNVKNAGADYDVKLNLYPVKSVDENNVVTYEKVYTVSPYGKATEIKNEPGDYSLFKTEGISPLKMTQVYIAEAVLTVGGVEYKSDLHKISIAEYFYKRLVVDANEGNGITSDQKNLYQSVLNYGTYLQKVDDAENKTTTKNPSDYYYINATEAGIVVDTYILGEKTGNFTAAIFTEGSLTLPAFSGEVPANHLFAGYDVVIGNATEPTLMAADEVLNYTDHAVIAPTFEMIDPHAGGVYYNNSTMIYGTRYSLNNMSQVNDGNAVIGGSILDSDNGNTYFNFQRNANTTTTLQKSQDISTKIDNHVYIVEADMMFGGIDAGTSSTIRLDFNLGSAYSKYPLFMVSADENGKVIIGTPNTVADGFEYLTQGTWYNIRFEIYANADTSKPAAKIFVNGEYAYTATTGAIETNSNLATTRFIIRFQGSETTSANCYVNMDNLYMGYSANAYDIASTDAAPVPGFSFGGGAFYNAEKADETNNCGKIFKDLNIGELTVSAPDENGSQTLSASATKKSNLFTLSSEEVTAATGNTVVVEADMLITNSTGQYNFNFMLSTTNDALEFCLGYANGYLQYANVTSEHNAPGYSNNLLQNAWYNFRFEIYESTVDDVTQISYVKLYVNNEYTATFTPTAHKTSIGTGVKLMYQDAAAEMKMANLFVGVTDKAYVDESAASTNN